MTIWTADKIKETKEINGVTTAYLCRRRGSDALGFEKDGIFWVAKGSILAPLSDLLEGCWEYRYRIESSDDGTFLARVTTRNENLLTKESAARVVVSDASATADLWQEV